MTAFKLFGEKLYLSPIWDLFNGKIITYTIGSRPTYSLVSTMLNQAFELLTLTDTLLIHSDQGWHYQMKQYRHALTKRGITQKWPFCFRYKHIDYRDIFSSRSIEGESLLFCRK
ncbi:hypothetical protein CN372_13795 [Bacillus anthracis]|nr:hypothetical protein CN372_13795 [Bacillus anthracis]